MPSTVERFIGFVFFAAFVAAGWMLKISVGVGIEGREPSLLLTGTAARLAGLLILALGMLMRFQSARVACVLGWWADPLCQ